MALKDSTDAAVLWTTKCDAPPPLYSKLSFFLLQMCVDTCVHVCVIYMLPASCDLHVYDFHQYPR